MIDLSVTKFGTGCPLIILHGLYGSGRNWLTIGKALSEHFTVYLVDQRNHGNSPHHSIFNYQVMTSDLEQLLAKLNLEKVCIMGHSMGGKTAMNFALNNTDRVYKLVVLDIALRSYMSAKDGIQTLQNAVHAKIINALSNLDIDFPETREELDKQLAQHIPQRAVRQFLLKNLKRNEKRDFYWGLNIQALQANLPNILEEIDYQYKMFKGPTLVISGKKSGYINEEDKIEFRSAFPNVKIEELDSGHWLHSEQPQQLIDLLKKFLPLN